ncbi:TonB family protein [Parendozoicomonas sp. Alg238-R29]|uniref:energy transducer TonB n=1 Tax=Parendozoicomonas sp. Alg238-R29 TaxID=2993446 RepID=UPI00248DB6CC|nr:TonB family protein [Parendozoicomonas sp. Alg238-R29]
MNILNSSLLKPATAISVLIAVVLHGFLIYGLSFALQEPEPPARTLEITLAKFPTTEAPKKADYLAQDNQQGSGSLDEKAKPSSDVKTPFQSDKPETVQLQQQTAQLQKTQDKKAERVTSVRSETKVQSQKVQEKPNPVPVEEPPRRQIDLSAEIASLEADFFRKRQAYAKKPVVHRINSASTRKADVFYQEAWRRKVMRIGQINYPVEARKQKIYGELRLAVQIRRDGSLKAIEVIRSSGYNVLDESAKNIVRMSSPFSPFPSELQEYDVIEIIRTWRFEPGNVFGG